MPSELLRAQIASFASRNEDDLAVHEIPGRQAGRFAEREIMELAVNYSAAAADLVREGRIRVDRFKCPAWPEVIAAARACLPIYVHLPLRVGAGIGDAINTETEQPADWDALEAILDGTGTPMINVHLAALVVDHPRIPLESTEAGDVEFLTECLIQDLGAIVRRFGPERVIAENADDGKGGILRGVLLPGVIRRTVEDTSCHFLFDISHARLAAHRLGTDVHEYISQLPTERSREIHLAGIQRLEGRWLELVRFAGIDDDTIQQFAGRWQDHLPIPAGDWPLITWAFAQIHRGAWGQPQITTFEYGGVGEIWERLTEPAVLLEQVPRLYDLLRHNSCNRGDTSP